MRRSSRIAVAVILVCCAGIGIILLARHKSAPPVELTFRIAVEPAQQVESVAKEANSAKVKYLAGKGAGVKPNLAQLLEIKALGNKGTIEARIELQTRDQADRYGQQLLQALRWQCGNKVQLHLEELTIR
jgi:hypothetical protein